MTPKNKVRASVPKIGWAIGLIFVVVGFASGVIGVVWLGLVVMLVAFFSRLTWS